MTNVLKLKKDLVYMEKARLEDEHAELNICIDNFDTYGMEPMDAWQFADKSGLVQDDKLIIPQGSTLINKESWQGNISYVFRTPNHIKIEVSLNFYGYEDEYLS